MSGILRIYQRLYYRSAGIPRKPGQSGLQLTSMRRGRDKDPSQIPEAPEINPDESTQTGSTALHAAGTLHGPGSCRRPEATSRSPFGAASRLVVRQTRPVSNRAARTTPNAHGQERGSLNFTCARGARREGGAASDLLGCHKQQTRLKAPLQQKKLLGAPLRGDGGACRAAGSK